MNDKTGTDKRLREELSHLRHRVRELEQSAAENKNPEKSISDRELDQKARGKIIELLDSIQQVQRLFITECDPKKVFGNLLGLLVHITGSEYGFLDEVIYDSDGSVCRKSLALSNISWDDESRRLYHELERCEMLFTKHDNLAGTPVLTGKILISNDPSRDQRSKGIPRGHPPIHSMMSVPLFFGSEMVGVAGVANRPHGYTEEIAAFLDPFLNTCASIIYAFKKIEKEKEFMESLLRKEAKLKEALQIARIGNWEYDTAEDILWWSDEVYRIFGLNPGDGALSMQYFLERVHPDDRENLKAQINSGLPYRSDYRILLPDGTEKYIHEEVKIKYDAEGHHERFMGTAQDVTERKKMEKALYLMKFSMENSADAVFQVTQDAQIIYANKAACDYLGYSCEELARMRIHGLDPDYPAERWPEHWKQFQEKKTLRFQTTHLTKSGAIIPVEISANHLVFDGQEFVIGFVRDTTDRKRAEAALRESEAKFRVLAEQSITGIALIQDGKFVYVNPRLAEMIGYAPDEMVGLSPVDLVVDAEQEMVREKIHQRMAGEVDTLQYNFRARHRDGKEVVMEIYGSSMTYRGRRAILSTLLDITERKRAEKELLESQERYRTLLNSVTDYIYTVEIHDGKDITTSHGPGCYAVTGYSPEDFASDPYLWYNMVYPDDKEAVRNLIRSVFSEKSIQPVEHRIIRRDGAVRWVKNTSVRKYDADGNIISYDGLISDITEKKHLEEKLFHAQKMESIGTLAGGIAHDFNNILTAIMGFASVLKTRMTDDPLRVFVENIEEAAENAANLTRGLLTFSRKQHNNPIRMDINEAIRRVEKLLERIIGEDIDLELDLSHEDVRVMADFGQMEQVLMNIAVNARDAMPQGGLLTITTGPAVIDEDFVRTRGYGQCGRYALVTISDTGSGMDEETRARIFEPFFSTKEVDKGTGLGLSIVYGIIKQHNGYITVDSMPGKGATFSIYVPSADRDAVEDRAPVKTGEPVFMGGIETILVAEDDALTRKLITSVLQETGYHVIDAHDGEDAVNKFMENKDSIHFVILDAIMPKKYGSDVYREIKKLRPDITGLLLSGYAMDKIDIEESGGRFKFMTKPIKPHELLTAIREGFEAPQ